MRSGDDLKPNEAKALIVDNDEIAQSIVSVQLKELGIETLLFSCGQDAWKYMEQNSKQAISLVVSAVRLFPGEGLTLLERIKSHELLAEIPVIMMDHELDPLFVYDAKRFEAHDYLQKPFNDDVFAQSLNRLPFLTKRVG